MEGILDLGEGTLVARKKNGPHAGWSVCKRLWYCLVWSWAIEGGFVGVFMSVLGVVADREWCFFEWVGKAADLWE